MSIKLSTVSVLANRSLNQNLMHSGYPGTAVPKVFFTEFVNRPSHFSLSPVPPSTEGLFTGYKKFPSISNKFETLLKI